MELRDYQSNIIRKVAEQIRKGNRRVLICLPTGGGKTAISSEIVRQCYAKGKRSIFCCHRQELIKQTFNTYRTNGLMPAFIKAGLSENPSNPCQIASINTLANRLDKYPNCNLLIIDEAHHQASTTWAKVAQYYQNAIIIGLSATPCRLDGKPLNNFFDTMVQEITTKELIDRGFLTPFKYYAPNILDESDLIVGSNGEYTRESVDTCVHKQAIIGNNIETYKKLCAGKRNVVFAVGREHGQEICEQYNKAGIKAEYLDGLSNITERNETLNRFAQGETKVLVNVDLFGEGFDLPAIEVVSLLRPTHSTSLYLQQVGRALRTSEGKTEAIILDHVNNYKRHGLPDEQRYWTLNGGLQTSHKKGNNVAIKRCPICFYAHAPALVCPNCGHVYTADERTIRQINGELVLIGSTEEKQAEKKEIVLAKTLGDLIKIENERNYKFGWAEKQWQMKTGENLFASLSGLTKIEKARGYKKGWAWVQQMKRKGL